MLAGSHTAETRLKASKSRHTGQDDLRKDSAPPADAATSTQQSEQPKIEAKTTGQQKGLGHVTGRGKRRDSTSPTPPKHESPYEYKAYAPSPDQLKYSPPAEQYYPGPDYRPDYDSRQEYEGDRAYGEYSPATEQYDGAYNQRDRRYDQSYYEPDRYYEPRSTGMCSAVLSDCTWEIPHLASKSAASHRMLMPGQ